MIVGLVIGRLQTLTQIQEQSVAFGTKTIVMLVVLSVSLPWPITSPTIMRPPHRRADHRRRCGNTCLPTEIIRGLRAQERDWAHIEPPHRDVSFLSCQSSVASHSRVDVPFTVPILHAFFARSPGNCTGYGFSHPVLKVPDFAIPQSPIPLVCQATALREGLRDLDPSRAGRIGLRLRLCAVRMFIEH